MKMKNILLGSIAVAALFVAGAAAAADLPHRAAPAYKAPPPAAPVFSWTGFYIGINGGGAWSHTDWDYVGGGDGSHDTSGGLVGGTIGYNFQFAPNWVFGIEADWDWADIKGSTADPLRVAFTDQSKIDSIGTVRGRLGPTFGEFFLYGTGGLAWANNTIQTVSALTGTIGSSTTAIGWAAGVGGEWAFAPNWSAKIEWLHYDVGSDQYTVDTGLLVNAREEGDIVRAGLNYRFGWGGGPVMARY